MKKERNPAPSITADIFKAILLTIIIVTFLFIVFHLHGNAQKIDSRMTSLFGAILAFSGLMTKQYLLKENISYLHKWKKVEFVINEIILHPKNQQYRVDEILNQLSKQNSTARLYMKYVIDEIKIIPIIPLFLVVLYGAALIASESQYVSLTCLALMLFLVSYLAQATITSNNLAIDTTDVDEIINEFEEALSLLNEK
ncbi:MAG: hypothetical protein WCZ86_12555 [Desulfurivibrionaceae bacterium]|jgi:exosortase/archaeosortase